MSEATKQIEVGMTVTWTTFKKFRFFHLGKVVAIDGDEAKIAHTKNGRNVSAKVNVNDLTVSKYEL